MRCRECGLELDERDLLRNGAYQCPECGTIHHTASSRRASPSPWRRKRKSAFASNENILTRKLWVLPLWSWIAIAVIVVVAVVLLLTLGLPASDPAVNNPPAATSVPDTENNLNPTDDAPELEGGLEPGEDVPGDPESESTQVAQPKETGILANDFVVSFEWAMNYLRYTSTLNLASEETGSSGEKIRKYSYEDWLNIELTLNPETNVIRTAVGSVTSGDNTNRTVAAFVCMLYGVDNTMDAKACATQINNLMSDNTRPFTRSAYTVTLEQLESGGYTLQIAGRQ